MASEAQELTVDQERHSEITGRLDRVEDRLDSFAKEQMLLREEFNTFRSDVDARIDQLNGRMDQFHERIERTERALNARINEVSDKLDGRINEVSDKLNGRINQLDASLNLRLDGMIKWTVGTIALFGTIISVLMTVLKFS